MADRVLVLLVEDEPIISKLVQDSLEDAGFNVMTAGHGGEATGLLDKKSG